MSKLEELKAAAERATEEAAQLLLLLLQLQHLGHGSRPGSRVWASDEQPKGPEGARSPGNAAGETHWRTCWAKSAALFSACLGRVRKISTSPFS